MTHTTLALLKPIMFTAAGIFAVTVVTVSILAFNTPEETPSVALNSETQNILDSSRLPAIDVAAVPVSNQLIGGKFTSNWRGTSEW